MNRFGVATVGVGGSHSSVRGHKLTLKLQVKDRATGGACPCRKSHPCRSRCMLIFVEDAAEAIVSAYVEAG